MYCDLHLSQKHKHPSTLPVRLSQAAGVDGSISDTLEVVREKFNDLIIALRGPPGIGKTITAGAIALAAGRPYLLSL